MLGFSSLTASGKETEREKAAMANRSTGGRCLKDEDFEEEDVWGVIESTGGSSPKVRKFGAFSSSSSSSPSSSLWSSSSSSRCAASAPRMIPRASNPSTRANKTMMARQSQAAMDTPGRRNVYGMVCSKKKSSCSIVNGGREYDDHDNGAYDDADSDDGDGDADDGDGHGLDDDDDDDDERVPPHEYIARRLARTQISSFSVCEGIGRTLKGRDLSKVRDTILRKTGFLER